MSLLSEFVSVAHGIAKDVIGTESITIGGGTSILGILNEANFNRDYEQGGFEQSASLEFVIDQAAFTSGYPLPAKNYEGKLVIARGENWRIHSIISGASFVKVSLSSSNKSG